MGLLIAIAIVTAGLAAVAEVWHTTLQREREKELLFVGNQFRQAISGYFQKNNRYPVRLEDLLKDDRFPGIRRFLRRIYPDPMTGKAEWGLVTTPDGQIVGVHSLSDDTPVKHAGFRARDAGFQGKTKYSEWVFSYAGRAPVAGPQPPAQGQVQPQAAPPVAAPEQPLVPTGGQ